MRRICIIGTGATALAVLDVAHTVPEAKVRVIRPENHLSPSPTPVQKSSLDRETYAQMLRDLRQELGFKFPPPKTHFGRIPDTRQVRGWGPIWRSNLHGGLTQFWGGSMVPFTDRELKHWPLQRNDLETDYHEIAAQVGITGVADGLREYFDDRFAERPPIDPIYPIELLIDRLNHETRSSFDIFAGAGRVAVETRSGHAAECTYSGECMTGCVRGAVYSALTGMKGQLNDSEIEQHAGVAHRIDLDRKRVHVRSADGEETVCPYDIVFVCAGAVQSVELLTSSLSVEPETPIYDNMILSFPVFFTGRVRSEPKRNGYFALTNGMLILRPHGDQEPVFQVQLYPNSDYFWQFNLPSGTWPAIEPIARWARNRLFWARAYLPSSQSQHYRMSWENNEASLYLARDADTSQFLSHVWPELRKAFSDAGFWVPPVAPAPAKTSAHYAGGFPMGGRSVDTNGCLGNGVYLCDSANFSDGPSTSPTLTAMANARRIARKALLGTS